MMKKICTPKSLDNSLTAEAVGNNEDLVTEIFLRLPVRSLVRFKLVSKHWFSLISDPQFARDRTLHSNPNDVAPYGLFFDNSLTKNKEIESVSLHDSQNHLSRVRVPSLSFLKTVSGKSRIRILQSCNGLLLCGFESQSRNEYIVCNPTTGKYKLLPQLIRDPAEQASGFTLAFDPSKSVHYKVVCKYLNLLKIPDSRIGIYSSETGEWSISEDCGDSRYPLFKNRSGFYWNHSIHWIEPSIRSYYSYDLENKNLQVLDMPHKPQSYSSRTLRYFGECRSHLHLIHVRNYCAKSFLVWERDREKLKWSLKYRVQICDLLSEFPEIRVKTSNGGEEYVYTILSVYKGEKEKDSAVILKIPGKVISYNFHYKTSKVLSELPSQGTNSLPYCYSTTFNFIQSLVSV